MIEHISRQEKKRMLHVKLVQQLKGMVAKKSLIKTDLMAKTIAITLLEALKESLSGQLEQLNLHLLYLRIKQAVSKERSHKQMRSGC